MATQVLVVDAQAEAWSAVLPILEGSGWAVTVAPDGFVGFNVAVKALPDVVVLEFDLPRVSGLELCRRIRGQPALAHVPIVVVSATTEEARIVEAFSAGAWDFVGKPIRPLEFIARLHAHTGLAHSIRAVRDSLAQQSTGAAATSVMPESPIVKISRATNSPRSQESSPVVTVALEGDAGDSLNLERMENLLINRALAQTNGNVARAARLLGINRSRIYRKFSDSNRPVP